MSVLVFMVMIVMMRVRVMVVSVMMAVMLAAVRCVRQAALQIRRDHLFDGRAGLSRAHGDAVMSKVGQCPMANAAGNDDRHSLLAQPTRKGAGFVFGCGLDFCSQYHPRVRIRFNQRKLTGAAEVSVQPAVFMRDGNAHGMFLFSNGHFFEHLFCK